MKNVLVRSMVKTGNRFRSIRSRFEQAETKPDFHFPYKNLVFKGGGIRGISYIGALEILEKYGILSQIDRVAGTSAGAITATLVSFRLNHQETYSRLRSLDFTKVPQTRTTHSKSREISFYPRTGEW